jgi:hypothetical protein
VNLSKLEASNDNEQKLTEGQWRVGVTFNPSQSPQVDGFKSLTAALIDGILAGGVDKRTAALAATAYEEAAMWAVKSLTKPVIATEATT